MAGQNVRAAISEGDFVTAIADALLAYLESHREVTSADLAALTGYSLVAIKQFRCGAYRSARMAAKLADAIPELAESMRCPHCHGLPTIAYNHYSPRPR